MIQIPGKFGYDVDDEGFCVRPAMWINLDP